jgi:chromosome segregation ATPase
MDSTNLRDFRPDNPDFSEDEDLLKQTDGEISASVYHEEINTLKIDKLSNRVTIISFILPCLVGIIIVFAYLDIKERMVDVDLTKQNQVERLFQQLEEKLNTLDVKIAKNQFDLENKLPELDKKNVLLEGRIAKLTTTKADTKTIKADTKIIKDQFAKLEKRIANNTNQDKSTLQTIERINKETLSSIKKNQNQFDKTARQIKKEATLFRKKFDTRLLELSSYEQEIGKLRKRVSLLDMKVKGFEQETASRGDLDETITQLKNDLSNHMEILDQQVNKLNQRLTANISRLQNDLDQLSKMSSSTIKPTSTKPKPRINPQINIDSSEPVTIEEESLIE